MDTRGCVRIWALKAFCAQWSRVASLRYCAGDVAGELGLRALHLRGVGAWGIQLRALEGPQCSSRRTKHLPLDTRASKVTLGSNGERMRRLLGLAYLAVLVAVILLTWSAPQALANHVQCGDVITEDTRLDSDLIELPGRRYRHRRRRHYARS